MHDTPLSLLVNQLMVAKSDEQKAKNERIEIEETIAGFLPGKDEGSVSAKDDFHKFKVTVTRKFNRTLDLDKYDEEKTTIPPDLDPVWLKPTLDITKLRAIQEANPELYKRCCAFIISKEAKTSVSVKEVG